MENFGKLRAVHPNHCIRLKIAIHGVFFHSPTAEARRTG
jgi:hypothetical protein